MSKMILCLGQTAEKPYYLERLGLWVYTVEELCFCIKENIVLMDESLAGKELALWLGEQCGLEELADLLKKIVAAKKGAHVFFGAILEYTGYYPQKETEKIKAFLGQSAGLNQFEKRKKIGDFFAESGKYEQAMREYSALCESIPAEDTKMLGNIYHNMGTVSCLLFLFERGAFWFEKAYQTSGDRESLEQHLYAMRLLCTDSEYVAYVGNRPADYYQASLVIEKGMQAAGQDWRERGRIEAGSGLSEKKRESMQAYREWMEQTGEQMKEAYRNMGKEN